MLTLRLKCNHGYFQGVLMLAYPHLSCLASDPSLQRVRKGQRRCLSALMRITAFNITKELLILIWTDNTFSKSCFFKKWILPDFIQSLKTKLRKLYRFQRLSKLIKDIYSNYCPRVGCFYKYAFSIWGPWPAIYELRAGIKMYFYFFCFCQIH